MPTLRVVTGPALTVAAALSLLATLGAAAPTTAAASSFTVAALLGSGQLEGSAPPSTTFRLVWVNADGEDQYRGDVTSDASGEWVVPIGWIWLEIADRITMSSSSETRTFVVPRLSAATDRVADTVSGRAPAGSVIKIVPHDCRLFVVRSDCSPATSAVVSTNASGRYSKDFTGTFNVKGADIVDMVWTSPHGDTLTVVNIVPYVAVSVGRPFAVGSGRPWVVNSISVRTAAGDLRGVATGSGSYTGEFGGQFRATNGNPVYPRIGDRISSDVAEDARFTMPTITTGGDASTDVVSGRCLPNARYVVVAFRRTETLSTFRYGTADGSGRYLHDLTADMDLISGDAVRIFCARGAGDILARVTVVP